ncbi:MAG TPA: hypothetical protein VKA59_12765 [Vicinamibacterales bacterium]|nr:hypothetical protein [Vicinamibacterales bacterium]
MATRRLAGACLVAATILFAGHANPGAQDTSRRPAVRLDPVSSILDAFASYSVVALGEGAHGNEQGHAFRLALIRNPRFAAIVNDIVIESGSARYQDVIDRYVRGEAVPEVALREIRENTVTPTPAWDRPMYDETFRAVRDVNRSLPPDRRLRILLGDPPIDWEEVTTPGAYRTVLMKRDSHPAEVIQREVLAKGRRALVVYGDGHFQARSERPGRSLVGILQTSGTKVFTVTSTFADLSAFQKDVAGWSMPWLASLKGTLLGAASYETFFGPPPPVDFFKANPRIEDHFDAVLVLGSSQSLRLAPLPYPRCTEPAYVEMRVGRMVASGMPPTVRDRLAAECAAAAPR